MQSVHHIIELGVITFSLCSCWGGTFQEIRTTQEIFALENLTSLKSNVFVQFLIFKSTIRLT